MRRKPRVGVEKSQTAMTVVADCVIGSSNVTFIQLTDYYAECSMMQIDFSLENKSKPWNGDFKS